MGMVKAMRSMSILPNFIVIDSAEGDAGAAPVEFTEGHNRDFYSSAWNLARADSFELAA